MIEPISTGISARVRGEVARARHEHGVGISVHICITFNTGLETGLGRARDVFVSSVGAAVKVCHVTTRTVNIASCCSTDGHGVAPFEQPSHGDIRADLYSCQYRTRDNFGFGQRARCRGVGLGWYFHNTILATGTASLQQQMLSISPKRANE